MCVSWEDGGSMCVWMGREGYVCVNGCLPDANVAICVCIWGWLENGYECNLRGWGEAYGWMGREGCECEHGWGRMRVWMCREECVLVCE